MTKGQSWRNSTCQDCRVKQTRARKLKHQYGLTLEDFQNLVKTQENKCLICKREMEEPNVDHCHTTGRVRGLLCFSCNVGIGSLKDNPIIVASALSYLLDFERKLEEVN